MVNIQYADLPPVGELSRSSIERGTRVWSLKTNLLNKWVRGVIIDTKEEQDKKLFVVRRDRMRPQLLAPEYLAYNNPASVVIPVFTRIIARYADPTCQSAHYYAGIVSEPPDITNGNRYLVFFDNGNAQYVQHEDINVVCAQSNDVADDLHETIRDYMRDYVLEYPEIPLINVEVDQFVKTEYNFKWYDAKVIEVDNSMVKMLFPSSNRVEWIYMGCIGGISRFKPLKKLLSNAEEKNLEAER